MPRQSALDSFSSTSTSARQDSSFRASPQRFSKDSALEIDSAPTIKTTQEIKCPYFTGNTIHLPFNPSKEPTKALIIHVFQPFTLSCVMIVRVHQEEGFSEPMVLKIFDRRFTTQLREDSKAKPWTLESEVQYHRLIENGGVAELIPTFGSFYKHRGDAAEDEAYFHHTMQTFYETEQEVYDSLRDIQGRSIPRLLCSLKFPVIPTLNSPSIEKYTAFPGILLQYIDGFPLSDLSTYAPKSEWQSVCDQAINTVHQITHKGILNTDVRTRSFIVQRDQRSQFRPFMIDFALCYFRRDCDDDDHFWAWKSAQDEEGTLAFAMKKLLKEGYVYQRSALYTELDHKFE